MRRATLIIEPLESRLLLAAAWGTYPHLIKQDSAITHYPSINGAGQAVAVIDTGIDYRHPALGAGFGPGFKVVAGYDFADNDSDPIDTDGHGTGVAGIIAANEYTYGGKRYRGLAPNAKLIALRIDNDRDDGQVYIDNIEKALQWVIDHRDQYNIVAVNLSLGYGNYTSPTTRDPYSDELEQLHDEGVFIAAASGNDGVPASGPPTIIYPAADPNVFAIGSINASDIIVKDTQRNDMLDLLAPGENVPAPIYNASTKQHSYYALTGTSFATPFAAGAAALLKQADPSLSADEIAAVLKRTGSANLDGDDETGNTTGLTYKRLNVDAALAAVVKQPPVQDDTYEPNDSTAAATVLPFNAQGRTGLENLRLVADDPDFYRFTLSTFSRVYFDLHASAAEPSFQLLSSSGATLASVFDGSTKDLAAGTYYLKATSGTTLSGTYGIALTAQAANPPPPPTGGPPSTGTWNDISYDHNGTLHAAWYDPASHSLKYASRNSSGTWSITRTVDTSSSGFANISIATDRKNLAGIAYYEAGGKDLKYARFNGSSFSVAKVDSANDAGEYASLAYNANGAPAISYYRRTTGDLYLASTVKGKWRLSAVDSKGDAGRFTSLALSPATGRWAVSYYSVTQHAFLYAEKTKTAWKHTTAAKAGGGGPTSLAFDRNKHPAFTLFDSKSGHLVYAINDGRKWTTSTLATPGSQGGASSLLFESNGPAAVYYYNGQAKSLVLARWFKGRWTYMTLEENAGDYLSGALSPSGAKTVLYHTISGRLKIG
jgi:hypothetical protein